ncbi:MAG TPA: ubiquinol-cytochrome C chaperone family protein [Hyphomonadaceae bacterium]|nr:ubiquinol-cytochrome C chaperone family protein [Hyphomonadaceae bacterium]
MAIGKWFQQSKRNRWAIDKLHHSIQNQALRPDFYYDGGARDNFSGRFEMTSLHAALIFRRLRTAGPAGKAMSQEVFDALFHGFDEALRDIGTGDLTVGKKIRKMGEAFYGRAKAYDEALGPDAAPSLLTEALMRNLGVAEGEVPRFVRYVRLLEDTLQRHQNEQLLQGEVNWPRLP